MEKIILYVRVPTHAKCHHDVDVELLVKRVQHLHQVAVLQRGHLRPIEREHYIFTCIYSIHFTFFMIAISLKSVDT